MLSFVKAKQTVQVSSLKSKIPRNARHHLRPQTHRAVCVCYHKISPLGKTLRLKGICRQTTTYRVTIPTSSKNRIARSRMHVHTSRSLIGHSSLPSNVTKIFPRDSSTNESTNPPPNADTADFLVTGFGVHEITNAISFYFLKKFRLETIRDRLNAPQDPRHGAIEDAILCLTRDRTFGR